jgi:phosphohistidine phosphatase
MRRLYLLRHAKSSWDSPLVEDFDRPLNGRGRRNAQTLGAYLVRAGIRPAVILCSAARRTVETLEQLHPAVEGIPASIESGLFAASKAQMVARLRDLDDHLPSALLVGHNPGIERLAASLCGGKGDPRAVARLVRKYPTCALAVLETAAGHWAEVEDGCCRLLAFLRPADLDEE